MNPGNLANQPLFAPDGKFVASGIEEVEAAATGKFEDRLRYRAASRLDSR
jgi:hypothetical protein